MEQEPLAMELLSEVKASAKRWFICFCVMVALEIATIFGFMWYISLPSEESTTQDVEQSTDGGGDNSFVGGDYNGETENKNN